MKENINWMVKPTDVQIKIKEKDKALIRTIYANARMPLKEIGKKLRLSKVAVHNRLKNLEKKKVITGYSCLINFGKLNFSTYQIGVKTGMSLKEKEDYLRRIQDCGYVSQILKLSGAKWDFLIRVTCKEKEFNKVFNVVSDPKIQNEDILSVQKFFAFVEKDEEFSLQTNFADLTKQDVNLLIELTRNSRQSVADLSDKIKMSSKTIMGRIKKFKKESIIISFPTEYNPLIYGDEAYLLVLTTKNRKVQGEIAKRLAGTSSTGVFTNFQNPDIISFHVVSNLEDLKKIERILQPFANEIRNHEFVRVEEQTFYNFFPKGIYEELMDE